MSIFSLRKSLREYASHLSPAQKRKWAQFRLNEGYVLHPSRMQPKGEYHPITGARMDSRGAA